MSGAHPAGPLAAALALALGGCGGGAANAGTKPAVAGSRAGADGVSSAQIKTASVSLPTLRVAGTVRLPGAVQLPATTQWEGGALALAGLDAADSSLARVTQVDRGHAHTLAQLPTPLHDAAAASVGGQAYLFGGGNASTASTAILAVDRTGVHEAARLPAPASDVAAAAIGGTAYVVGGYTETVPLRTIVAFTPGGPGAGAKVRVAGILPRPLRYAAVAAVGGRLLIAGGTSGETAERAILSFDPTDGHVRQIGELPHPLTHAAGASLNGWMYVLGGRGGSLWSQTSEIFAIDPTSGAAHTAGRLPEALSDIGAASLPDRIVAIGGRNSAGTVSETALTLVPRAR